MTAAAAIARFQVGVKALFTADDRLLVVRHPRGFWDLIGGRIGGSETIEQALRREIAEELPGVADVEIGSIAGAARIPEVSFPDGSGLLLVLYHVTATLPRGLSDEHTESRWVTAVEARSLGSVVAAAADSIDPTSTEATP